MIVMLTRPRDTQPRPRPGFLSQGQLQNMALMYQSNISNKIWPDKCLIKITTEGQRSRKYEGRSINKLHNSVILLVFQMLKMRNMRFVRNLILTSRCEFYDYDVTVTSLINSKYGDVATKIIP